MAQVKIYSLPAMVQLHHPRLPPRRRRRRPYLLPVRSFEPFPSACTPPLIDVDDFYEDPSDRLPFQHALSSNDETETNQDAPALSFQANGIEPLSQRATIDSVRLQPHVYGGQDESTMPVHHSHRGGKNQSPLFLLSFDLQGNTRITPRAIRPFVITVHRMRLAIRLLR